MPEIGDFVYRLCHGILHTGIVPVTVETLAEKDKDAIIFLGGVK